jgi:hypothetical protein
MVEDIKAEEVLEIHIVEGVVDQVGLGEDKAVVEHKVGGAADGSSNNIRNNLANHSYMIFADTVLSEIVLMETAAGKKQISGIGNLEFQYGATFFYLCTEKRIA